MLVKIIKNLCLILLICVISSCSSYKYEKRDYWLKHQYKQISYIDTNKLNSKATSFVVEGAIAKQKGNLPLAVVNYMLALRYDSTAAILYAISDCFYWMTEYNLAIEYAVHSLKKEPNFVPCYEILCRSYLYLNDIKNATITMECAVKINENEESLFYLANMYEYQNSPLTKETYQKLINKYKSLPAAERLYNIEQLDLNFEKAGTILYNSWKIQPNDFKLVMELINNWFIENKIDSIINNVDKFDRNFDIDDLETMYNYIIVLMDTNKVGYNEIISKIDNRFNFSQILNLNAGEYAIKNNDIDKAKIYFDKVINSSDILPETLLKCVNIYYDNGYQHIAKNTLNEFIDKYPNKWEYPYWRGVLEENEKNYDSCIKYLKISQSIDTNNTTIIIDKILANLYFHIENYNLSDSLYEKIINQTPDPITCNNYAYSLSVRGINLDRALELSKRSLNYSPTSPEYLDTYGWIHYKMGDYDKALNYLEQSLSYNNKNSEVYLHLADIYMILDNNSYALKIIENAIEIEPNNTELIQKKITIQKKIEEEKLIENKN